MRYGMTLAVAGVAAALGVVPAMAVPTQGSAAILTNRNCTAPAGTACASVARNFTDYAGGANVGFYTSATNMANQGASAFGRVAFGAGYLPEIGAGSAAGAQTRSGGNIVAFRAFTYTGASAIDLVLNGALDYSNSGDLLPGEAAGEGLLGAYLSIQTISAIAGITDSSTGQDIITSNLVNGFAGCGNADVRAARSYSSAGTAAGAHVADLSLSTACDGGAITLNPGDQFVVVATLQAISNRGGFVDAMHTLKVSYDLERTVFTGTDTPVGASFLATSFAGVPEPATWATMLLGFGLVGAAARRRTRVRFAI